MLRKLGFYDKYKKRQKNLAITEVQGILKLKRKQEINSIKSPIPIDQFPELTDNLISLNLAEEQQKDADIRTVTGWIQKHNQQPELNYDSSNFKSVLII